MENRPILIVLLLVLPFSCTSFDPDQPLNRRILVLLDDPRIKASHSIFFRSLEIRGYDLDFKLADDPKINLQKYGEYLYDGLILFSPTTERFGGSIGAVSILEFVDSGHDLIIAADESASGLIREVATECGADFEEDREAKVIDHTSHAVSTLEVDHTLIASDDLIQSNVILGPNKIEAPILFQGIGHSINPSNQFALKVLWASPAAYSSNPKSKLSNPPSLIGSDISLLSVVQARNNARVLITGSLSMFSNRFLRSAVKKVGSDDNYDKSGNEQFLTELSKWVFHERGHLKAVNPRHNKAGEAHEPAVYRVNDELEYGVEMYEWSGAGWVPYVAEDVQIQFYMMSPYVLKTLGSDGNGVYRTEFKVPDVYGVFQFKIEYCRLGYSTISLSKQIPVRPYRHNEYQRFIPAAYPYYGAAFSMMSGFFIFCTVFLNHK